MPCSGGIFRTIRRCANQEVAFFKKNMRLSQKSGILAKPWVLRTLATVACALFGSAAAESQVASNRLGRPISPSSDEKTQEDRLRTILENWQVSEYDFKRNPDGTYYVRLTHPGADLSLLKEFPISYLDIQATDVKDLAPLSGMPLKTLVLSQPASDLSPLHGIALEELGLGSDVSDLSPLKGMRLRALTGHCPKVADLTPLRGQPLNVLQLTGAQVVDLTPLAGAPLTYLDLGSCTNIIDLSPLAHMPLTSLVFDSMSAKTGTEAVRAIPSLKSINGRTPEVFWKGFDMSVAARVRIEDVKQRLQRNHIPYERLQLVNGLCELKLTNSAITDLSCLKGAAIRSLWLTGIV